MTRSARLYACLILSALGLGCSSGPLPLEGFPPWEEARAQVAAGTPPLSAGAEAEGVAAEPAELRCRFEVGQRWRVRASTRLETRVAATGEANSRSLELGSPGPSYDSTEISSFEVVSVEAEGRAKLRWTLESVRSVLISDEGEQVLDTAAGLLSGDAGHDQRGRAVGVPLVFVVDARGQVEAVEGAAAFRAALAKGAEDPEKVASDYSDGALLLSVQHFFPNAPRGELRPGQSWQRKLPQKRLGSEVVEEVLYLGTCQVEGERCAKLYTRRVLEGEEELDGELLTVRRPSALGGISLVRLSDGRVLEGRPIRIDTDLMIGDEDGQIAVGISLELDYRFEEE